MHLVRKKREKVFLQYCLLNLDKGTPVYSLGFRGWGWGVWSSSGCAPSSLEEESVCRWMGVPTQSPHCPSAPQTLTEFPAQRPKPALLHRWGGAGPPPLKSARQAMLEVWAQVCGGPANHSGRRWSPGGEGEDSVHWPGRPFALTPEL